MKQTTVTIEESTHEVSPLLYGLFLEDISFSCDGGLNTNMVINHSFDGVYMDSSYSQLAALEEKKAPDVFPDRLRYWEFEGGKIVSMSDEPASEWNPWYARLDISSGGVLKNRGYNGGHGRKENVFSIREGHCYEMSVYLRNVSYEGTITAAVKDSSGRLLTDSGELLSGPEWKKCTIRLQGTAAGRGALEIAFSGEGVIDIDCIIFSDTDVWGKDDERWSGGHFRKDMVEALKELKPRFMRFPGGCIVEGAYPGNEYAWKDTVGPVIDRSPQVNLWAALTEDKGYCQSYQIGFYEFFLLCEDLGIEPLPIVWAGLNCQFRSNEVIDTESTDFYEKVVQNALDLIEYANGDPAVSKWAKLRADAGHPAPFNMKMIGIGNENYGADYHKKFEIVKREIQARYPEMRCVMSSGAFPDGKDLDDTWETANEKFPDVCIDEHFYKSNEWFYSQIHRYDSYSREGAKVFIGEYAANDLTTEHKMNTFGSALAEAAFLTGVEKNSDVVAMTSYAPLFAMSEGMQWSHNLIWFNPEYILKTPNYFVQQMFAAHIGENVIDYKGMLPEGVYLSVTADKNRYYVKIVNTGDGDANIRIDFDEKIKGQVSCTSMHSDDLECANELTFTGTPVYRITPETYELLCKDHVLEVLLSSHSINVYEISKL
ncbi:hypothetical protein LKD70_04350 [Ruminococcus sp. CLA-AA-H200]|uniref:non-reducing end alpha-L-arabinofuranosidase n=1 Tax=Ruminococcus turbiniformis TaxID=2881258 RepID=A0ABS8FVT1_9FIRM|nr:alpha-L-arabinofuranosidase C-terminal domain-containing protein [Ruminococcus turbiniformis]MCC2253674.1 hypothetical protein [Ruminococcus turbiniformis]